MQGCAAAWRVAAVAATIAFGFPDASANEESLVLLQKKVERLTTQGLSSQPGLIPQYTVPVDASALASSAAQPQIQYAGYAGAPPTISYAAEVGAFNGQSGAAAASFPPTNLANAALAAAVNSGAVPISSQALPGIPPQAVISQYASSAVPIGQTPSLNPLAAQAMQQQSLSEQIQAAASSLFESSAPQPAGWGPDAAMPDPVQPAKWGGTPGARAIEGDLPVAAAIVQAQAQPAAIQMHGSQSPISALIVAPAHAANPLEGKAVAAPASQTPAGWGPSPRTAVVTKLGDTAL